ncbi:MAG: hypothetical protein MUO22_02295 [Sedimentisphaerales bacterium]|nr:hypothetical protein [Sedimentisphaerales bacterium]
MWNFFEQPWTLLAAAIIALLIILLLRGMFSRKSFWLLLLIPLLLTLIGFGLDHIVRTDNEKIRAVLKAVIQAAKEENPDGIEPFISDNYKDSLYSTKQRLMHFYRARLAEPTVEQAITTIINSEITSPTANFVFTVRVVFDDQSYVTQTYKKIVMAKLQMAMAKQADKNWLISRIELLEVDLQPANWSTIRQVPW